MDAINNTTSVGDIHTLGPHLTGSFDFTLNFEQSILSILPSALLLIISPLRLTFLFRKENHARGGCLLWTKLAVVTVLSSVSTHCSVGTTFNNPN